MTSQSALQLLFIFVLITTSGCGPTLVRPDLYPNDHLNRVGKDQVERDIAECNELATTYVKNSEKFNKIARETATGATIGAASGALAGVIVGGSVGRSVGAGAAVGAIVPLLQRLFESDEPNPNRERFVQYCLTDRGYQVL